MINNQSEHYSSTILRVGISLVFLWFGVQGFMNPGEFSGLVPSWMNSIVAAQTLVKMHGLFEIIFGLLLISGVWIRVTSILLFLSLLNTIFLLPYGAIMVRDIGLAFALLSIALSKNQSNQNSLKV